MSTFVPGLMPSILLSRLGITIWPFADILAVGIDFCSSNSSYRSLIHQGITVDDGLVALRPDGDDMDGRLGEFL